MMDSPFSLSSPTISLSVTSTASAAVLIPGTGNTIRLVNTGANKCFVAVGVSSIAATTPSGTSSTTSTCILAGSDVVFSRSPSSETYISAICESTETATLLIQSGEGI